MDSVTSPDYATPQSLDAALRLLAAGGVTVMAGGTDVYPMLVGRDLPAAVLDITQIDTLRGITLEHDESGRAWRRVGACTTWADIAHADLGPDLRGLQHAARLVGAAQVQNVATIAGNLCTASPAGDGIPVLLALDAQVELCSLGGTRRLSLSEFITGYRSTARAADELVTGVLMPVADGTSVSSFVKLGTRSHLVISLAMVAASVTRAPDGRVIAARVAVGACSPVAQRLVHLEQRVVAAGAAGSVVALMPDDLAVLSPIDDIRCSAEYRREVVPELVRRALGECGVSTV